MASSKINKMKKNITIFTFFAVVFVSLSAFFLFTKETHAATDACTKGEAVCMLPGNCATGDTEDTDPICGAGSSCCVPPAGQSTDTCANAGGTCLYSCTASDTNEGIKDCTGGKTCCIVSTAQQQNGGGDEDLNDGGGNGGTGLVQCGTGDTSGAASECDFAAFMSLVNRLINFMLFVLAIPFAAISFAYAGYLYLSSSAGNEGNVKKAHEIFSTVAINLIIAFSAWLVIHAIIIGLGVSETYNFLGS